MPVALSHVLRWALLGIALVLLGVGCPRITPSTAPSPEVPDRAPGATFPAPHPAAVTPAPARKVVDLQSLHGAHAAFANVITIPATWEAEVIPDLEAISLYDPAAPGGSRREQSQIFLRHFRANDFKTLATVTIHARTPGTVAGRPAVKYLIEKKPGVPPFPGQPAWRNGRHRVTDVRLADTRPSEFLVVAQNPDLPDVVFDEILQSLTLSSPRTSLVTPTREFASAITKKPFGIFITPETSPVQPERFRGFHTGADIELPAGTPVFAIAAGTVLQSGTVSGYGGLVAVRHTIGGERLVGIYGHLDPGRLPSVGSVVRGGYQLGVLGAAFSDETDGERAHLHFGLYTGSDFSVAGYASSRSALSAWLDPVIFFQARAAREP